VILPPLAFPGRILTRSSEESRGAAIERDGPGVMHRLFVPLQVVLAVALVVAAGIGAPEALGPVLGEEKFRRRPFNNLD
jgi:hypothetical protein